MATTNRKLIYNYLTGIILLAGSLIILHLIAINNYLFFHVLVEFFSIIIAFALFTITWHARKMMDNKYLLFLGISALFLGFLDLMHTLTYPGMNILGGKIYYANQFWIATRFLESITLLFGFLFITQNWKVRPNILLIIYTLVTAVILLSILEWKNFPICYVQGKGQTPFKIYSEYVIIGILFVALFFLYKSRNHFDRKIYYFIAISIIATAMSEFFFTLYSSNYGFFNQLGHYFKLLSFYLIYKANIETAFIKPTEVIYRELMISREQIAHYNHQLQEEIATRDKLFSIIAHDLRSPFTAILGLTDLMITEISRYNYSVLSEYATKIQNTGNKTFALLENLLQWSQLKKGTIEPNFELFEVDMLIGEITALYVELAKAKNIELKVKQGDKLRVFADREMIRTVIRNLVSNAIKFTHKGGSVTIETKTYNDKPMITVSDSGMGMDRETVQSLFKGSSSISTKGTEDEKGTGLGLMICKEFVELNRGEIRVKSEPGKGSDFSIVLSGEYND